MISNSDRQGLRYVQLNIEEYKLLRSQNVISSHGGVRYAPFAFTEQGVAMLSSVLKSKQAIEVNIKIIRVFTKLRQALGNTLHLTLEVEEIKKKLMSHDKNIELVFDYLDKLIAQKNDSKRNKIGYTK